MIVSAKESLLSSLQETRNLRLTVKELMVAGFSFGSLVEALNDITPEYDPLLFKFHRAQFISALALIEELPQEITDYLLLPKEEVAVSDIYPFVYNFKKNLEALVGFEVYQLIFIALGTNPKKS